jgi:hypothetical protein
MVAVRLAKLRFIAEEMALARYLATHAPDAFDARILALHGRVHAFASQKLRGEP